MTTRGVSHGSILSGNYAAKWGSSKWKSTLQGHVLYKRFNGTAVSTANPDVTYAYNALGLVVSTTDVNDRTIAYDYDQASKRLHMYYPDTANYVFYTRDNMGRTKSATLNGTTTYLYQQGFDNRGFRTSLTRGASAAGGTTTFGYDGIGRMTSMGINIDGATTTHDASWTFTRNPSGQVYSWAATGPYDYLETATATVSKTYDGLNRDASIAAVSGGYDTNGNVTKDTSRVMKYDVYNRLLSVAALATPTTPYMTLAYDPEGRLASVATTTNKTEFLYDGTNLIGEYTHVGSSSTVHTSDTMSARYVHGEGVDEPLVWYSGSAVTSPRYLYANYQGSVVAYANASGAFSESYAYDPYGVPVNSTGGAYWLGSRFRYTGQIALPDASLYYYKARVYDPAAGRFLQTDPIGSDDDLDLYVYVGEDPINETDPTGECPMCISAAVGFGLGFAIDVAKQTVVDGKSLKNVDYKHAAIEGVIGGVAGATGVGVASALTKGTVVAGIVAGAVTGGIANGGHAVHDGKSTKEVAIDTVVGAAGGAIGGGVGAKASQATQRALTQMGPRAAGTAMQAGSVASAKTAAKVGSATGQIVSSGTKTVVNKACNGADRGCAR